MPYRVCRHARARFRRPTGWAGGAALVVLTVAVLSSVLVVPVPATALGGAQTVPGGLAADAPMCAVDTWSAPVVGVVIDGFRPPAHIGASGNRGWEYRTEPGTEVRSAAPGIVTFSGPIGRHLYAAVRHCDGSRSTYSYLASIQVEAGDRVAMGDRVGLSTSRFHFGVRRDGRYVDPSTLLARPARRLRVHLARLVGSWASHW